MITITDNFYIDGKPLKIISGSIHYFRIVPEHWQDRLEKLINMGCNTVETYIPWNFHEEQKECFRWDGRHDVERFISLAESLGLYVIIRPSPFICAEWEFGGLPAWLLKDPKMKVRSMNENYIAQVTRYYREMIPRIVPHQIDKGGKVILVQIENEYGYYGISKRYLRYLADLMRELGITVPFVTSDGPWGGCILRGSIKEALPTGNFGSRMQERFRVVRRYAKKRPLFCMEFWCGWFDAWGEQHHTSDLEQNKKDLRYALETGHINFYMFEGGTNFGFMAGHNLKSKEADITSYDYDSPLREDGQITPKYEAFKKIISEFTDIHEVPLTTDIKFGTYGIFDCTAKTGLFDTLDKMVEPIESERPMTMEHYDQAYGYILYRKKMESIVIPGNIKALGASGRVKYFENGTYADILVENTGRTNFGRVLNRQHKGIGKAICINGKKQKNFQVYCLTLDEEQINRIDFDSGFKSGKPSFYKFEFSVDEICDTYLHLDGWGKGCAFINGFNLGRYWNIGPQTSLYVPGPLLKKGKNTIIVFETEGRSTGRIELKAQRGW